PVKVKGAGRTDAGVHALGQVAHIDLAKDWRTDTVRDALTAHLRPHPVAVLGAPAALSLPHRQPPLRSDARAGARLAGRGPARRGGDGAGGATPGRPP